MGVGGAGSYGSLPLLLSLGTAVLPPDVLGTRCQRLVAKMEQERQAAFRGGACWVLYTWFPVLLEAGVPLETGVRARRVAPGDTRLRRTTALGGSSFALRNGLDKFEEIQNIQATNG